MSSKYFKHPLGTLAYRDTGDSEQAIVCLHSNSSSKDAFLCLEQNELLKRWRIIAVDLPGHGESSDSELGSEAYTIAGMATMINCLIEQLDCNCHALVGWSLGGHIAMEQAAQNPSITKLVLSGTPPAGPGAEELTEAFIPSEHMALTGKEVFNEHEALIYAAHTIGKKYLEFPNLVEAAVRADGKCRATMTENWGKSTAGTNQARFVKNWNGELAILQGEEDSFVSKSYLDQLLIKNLWRDAVQYIPNAGHAPMLDTPQQYCQLLADFLSE
ncbi:alpha/beta hydrolase [uncultured Pseudoteredinibacter sp.]|uniref:alpha/beta fold hydrolase n=1 Tax=uncultured Pseudoteredinibacter sp. TaxID=1641701 RepID=UPI00261ED6F1|nr:alpha/beta hydrolase [uncultured Pseudoteredinibacter sp.]